MSHTDARDGQEGQAERLEAAVEKWRGQSRKGFVELCILAYVRSASENYGFAMLEALRSSGLDLSEGTLYPLLARLVRESLLTSRWDTPDEGHPRKYYELSEYGAAYLERVLEERGRDHDALDFLLSGGAAKETTRPRGGQSRNPSPMSAIQGGWL